MATATATVNIRITVAWWLPLYLRTLALFCWTMGTTPDMDKVQRVVKRALSARLTLD